MSFTTESVKRLREADFTLESRERVCLKYDDCTLVLFYAENAESKQMAQLWIAAAAQVAGPIFAACNLINERAVAEAFSQLNMDPTNPFHWCGLKEIPFVLVYQRGWPKGFFNGERTVETFVDYALTLACQAGYEEHEHLARSMQVENRLVMISPGVPGPMRTKSVEYIGTSPIRHYNPSFTPVVRGSKEEADAIRLIQSRSRPTTPVTVVSGPVLTTSTGTPVTLEVQPTLPAPVVTKTTTTTVSP